MGKLIHTTNDVIGYLKSQHKRIESTFDLVLASSGDDRKEAFRALRRLMAVHEIAEEEVVHPTARHALPDGHEVVVARLREENQAKIALGKLEELDPDGLEFEEEIRNLRDAVLAHAKAEETQEFDRLAVAIDEKKLKSMRRAVEIAEAIAPTRPHAGIESATENMLVGPFASMVDRTRDALTGKH